VELGRVNSKDSQLFLAIHHSGGMATRQCENIQQLPGDLKYHVF
jgi:hypothetical protein